MNKELHQQEIEQSHLKGFGGSDAAMFAAIAKNGIEGLGRTHLRRIAEVMGLCEPRPHYVNEAMENGHFFEDYWAEKQAKGICWRREAKLRLYEEVQPKNFEIFAHADFLHETIGNFSDPQPCSMVYELKFSQSDTDNVMSTYKWQLQWYYMLGATEVVLVHGSGSDPYSPEIKVVSVEKDIDSVGLLLRGIDILDEAIGNGWKPQVDDVQSVADCPSRVAMQIAELHIAMQQLKEAQEKVDSLKQSIGEYMADNLIGSITTEAGTSLSYVKPSTTRTFDSKAYFKANPIDKEVKEQYMTEKTRAGYVAFKEATPKKSDSLA